MWARRGTWRPWRVPEEPDRQGHCVDWMLKATGSLRQERPGVQVLGNVILIAWEGDGGGGGQLVPLEKPRAVKRPAGGRSLAPNPSSATHELCDLGRVT